MTRIKIPDRPLSLAQILKKERAERADLRKARQALKAELDWQKMQAKAERERVKAEFAQWRENQASRREYLAELKRLRDEDPQTLLEREIDLLKLARSRAKHLEVVALQTRNMSDLDDPQERGEVQKAQDLADEALREAKSLAVVVCRRKRMVAKFEAQAGDRATDARREPQLIELGQGTV